MKPSSKTKESIYQKTILEYLHMRKIYVWRNQSTGIFNQKYNAFIPLQKKGVSDILGILPDGRFLAIEVKKPGGTVSELQNEFIQDINSRGGLAFVAITLEDVDKNLKEYFNKNK